MSAHFRMVTTFCVFYAVTIIIAKNILNRYWPCIFGQNFEFGREGDFSDSRISKFSAYKIENGRMVSKDPTCKALKSKF